MTIHQSNPRASHRRLAGPYAGLARVALAGLGLLTSAAAQAEPGDHIRAGQAVITPKVSMGLEYGTNLYHADGSDPTAVEGGTDFRLAPGVEIGADGPDLSFALTGDYELRKYLGSDISNLDRFNDFQVGSKLQVLKNQPVGLIANETVGMRNVPAESPVSTHPYETQFRNETTGGLQVRPTSAIQVTAGAIYLFNDYQVATTAAEGQRSFDRSNSFGPQASLEWKFFPRTELVVTGDYELNRWNDNLIPVGDNGPGGFGDLELPNSNFLRLMAGMRGRVTEKVIATAMAGYGVGNFLDESVPGAQTGSGDFTLDVNGLQHLLVDTQVKYEASKDNAFTLGFQKNFQASYFTNYDAYNYGYARLESRFSRRFGLTGEFGGRLENYEGDVIRNDVFLNARGDLAYYLQDWASISGGAWWTQRASSDADVEYNDLNIHVLTNITY